MPWEEALEQTLWYAFRTLDLEPFMDEQEFRRLLYHCVTSHEHKHQKVRQATKMLENMWSIRGFLEGPPANPWKRAIFIPGCRYIPKTEALGVLVDGVPRLNVQESLFLFPQKVGVLLVGKEEKRLKIAFGVVGLPSYACNPKTVVTMTPSSAPYIAGFICASYMGLRIFSRAFLLCFCWAVTPPT